MDIEAEIPVYGKLVSAPRTASVVKLGNTEDWPFSGDCPTKEDSLCYLPVTRTVLSKQAGIHTLNQRSPLPGVARGPNKDHSQGFLLRHERSNRILDEVGPSEGLPLRKTCTVPHYEVDEKLRSESDVSFVCVENGHDVRQSNFEFEGKRGCAIDGYDLFYRCAWESLENGKCSLGQGVCDTGLSVAVQNCEVKARSVHESAGGLPTLAKLMVGNDQRGNAKEIGCMWQEEPKAGVNGIQKRNNMLHEVNKSSYGSMSSVLGVDQGLIHPVKSELGKEGFGSVSRLPLLTRKAKPPVLKSLPQRSVLQGAALHLDCLTTNSVPTYPNGTSFAVEETQIQGSSVSNEVSHRCAYGTQGQNTGTSRVQMCTVKGHLCSCALWGSATSHCIKEGGSRRISVNKSNSVQWREAWWRLRKERGSIGRVMVSPPPPPPRVGVVVPLCITSETTKLGPTRIVSPDARSADAACLASKSRAIEQHCHCTEVGRHELQATLRSPIGLKLLHGEDNGSRVMCGQCSDCSVLTCAPTEYSADDWASQGGQQWLTDIETTRIKSLNGVSISPALNAPIRHRPKNGIHNAMPGISVGCQVNNTPGFQMEFPAGESRIEAAGWVSQMVVNVTASRAFANSVQTIDLLCQGRSSWLYHIPAQPYWDIVSGHSVLLQGKDQLNEYSGFNEDGDSPLTGSKACDYISREIDSDNRALLLCCGKVDYCLYQGLSTTWCNLGRCFDSLPVCLLSQSVCNWPAGVARVQNPWNIVIWLELDVFLPIWDINKARQTWCNLYTYNLSPREKPAYENRCPRREGIVNDFVTFFGSFGKRKTRLFYCSERSKTNSSAPCITVLSNENAGDSSTKLITSCASPFHAYEVYNGSSLPDDLPVLILDSYQTLSFIADSSCPSLYSSLFHAQPQTRPVLPTSELALTSIKSTDHQVGRKQNQQSALSTIYWGTNKSADAGAHVDCHRLHDVSAYWRTDKIRALGDKDTVDQKTFSQGTKSLGDLSKVGSCLTKRSLEGQQIYNKERAHGYRHCTVTSATQEPMASLTTNEFQTPADISTHKTHSCVGNPIRRSLASVKTAAWRSNLPDHRSTSELKCNKALLVRTVYQEVNSTSTFTSATDGGAHDEIRMLYFQGGVMQYNQDREVPEKVVLVDKSGLVSKSLWRRSSEGEEAEFFKTIHVQHDDGAETKRTSGRPVSPTADSIILAVAKCSRRNPWPANSPARFARLRRRDRTERFRSDPQFSACRFTVEQSTNANKKSSTITRSPCQYSRPGAVSADEFEVRGRARTVGSLSLGTFEREGSRVTGFPNASSPPATRCRASSVLSNLSEVQAENCSSSEERKYNMGGREESGLSSPSIQAKGLNKHPRSLSPDKNQVETETESGNGQRALVISEQEAFRKSLGGGNNPWPTDLLVIEKTNTVRLSSANALMLKGFASPESIRRIQKLRAYKERQKDRMKRKSLPSSLAIVGHGEEFKPPLRRGSKDDSCTGEVDLFTHHFNVPEAAVSQPCLTQESTSTNCTIIGDEKRNQTPGHKSLSNSALHSAYQAQTSISAEVNKTGSAEEGSAARVSGLKYNPTSLETHHTNDLKREDKHKLGDQISTLPRDLHSMTIDYQQGPSNSLGISLSSRGLLSSNTEINNSSCLLQTQGFSGSPALEHRGVRETGSRTLQDSQYLPKAESHSYILNRQEIIETLSDQRTIRKTSATLLSVQQSEIIDLSPDEDAKSNGKREKSRLSGNTLDDDLSRLILDIGGLNQEDMFKLTCNSPEISEYFAGSAKEILERVRNLKLQFDTCDEPVCNEQCDFEDLMCPPGSVASQLGVNDFLDTTGELSFNPCPSRYELKTEGESTASKDVLVSFFRDSNTESKGDLGTKEIEDMPDNAGAFSVVRKEIDHNKVSQSSMEEASLTKVDHLRQQFESLRNIVPTQETSTQRPRKQFGCPPLSAVEETSMKGAISDQEVKTTQHLANLLEMDVEEGSTGDGVGQEAEENGKMFEFSTLKSLFEPTIEPITEEEKPNGLQSLKTRARRTSKISAFLNHLEQKAKSELEKSLDLEDSESRSQVELASSRKKSSSLDERHFSAARVRKVGSVGIAPGSTVKGELSQDSNNNYSNEQLAPPASKGIPALRDLFENKARKTSSSTPVLFRAKASVPSSEERVLMASTAHSAISKRENRNPVRKEREARAQISAAHERPTDPQRRRDGQDVTLTVLSADPMAASEMHPPLPYAVTTEIEVCTLVASCVATSTYTTRMVQGTADGSVPHTESAKLVMGSGFGPLQCENVEETAVVYGESPLKATPEDGESSHRQTRGNNLQHEDALSIDEYFLHDARDHDDENNNSSFGSYPKDSQVCRGRSSEAETDMALTGGTGEGSGCSLSLATLSNVIEAVEEQSSGDNHIAHVIESTPGEGVLETSGLLDEMQGDDKKGDIPVYASLVNNPFLVDAKVEPACGYESAESDSTALSDNGVDKAVDKGGDRVMEEEALEDCNEGTASAEVVPDHAEMGVPNAVAEKVESLRNGGDGVRSPLWSRQPLLSGSSSDLTSSNVALVIPFLRHQISREKETELAPVSVPEEKKQTVTAEGWDFGDTKRTTLHSNLERGKILSPQPEIQEIESPLNDYQEIDLSVSYLTESATCRNLDFGKTVIAMPKSWHQFEHEVCDAFWSNMQMIDPSFLGLQKEDIRSIKVGRHEVAIGESAELEVQSRDWYPKKVRVMLEGQSSPSTSCLAMETLISKELLEKYVTLIEKSHYVIFYGPSGTGKSYLIRKIASFLLRRTHHASDEVEFASEQADPLIVSNITPEKWEELRTVIQTREEGRPLILVLDGFSPAFMEKVDDVSQTLESFDKELTYIIASFTQSTCAEIPLAWQQSFRWVWLPNHEEPVQGLLRRYLRRKFVSVGSSNREDLFQVADWLSLLWQHCNSIIERFHSTEQTIGPTMLFSCPADMQEAEEWFVDVWNYSVLPYFAQTVKKGLRAFGQRCAWESPIDWMTSTYPWRGGGCNMMSKIKRVRMEDIGFVQHREPTPTGATPSEQERLMDFLKKLEALVSEPGNEENGRKVYLESAL